jgi:hypothetical protein
MGDKTKMKSTSADRVLPFSKLPGLLKALSDEVASFLDLKLTLFRKELWHEGQGFLSRFLGIGAAALIALVGFQVLIAALVLALNQWLHSLSLSCLIVGVVCFVGGATVAVLLARRLSGGGFQKSRVELHKDRQWIETQTSRF